MINTAIAMQSMLIRDLEAAGDGEAFRRIWEDRITDTSEPGRAPGFPNDLGPGYYYNGYHLLSKAGDGSTIYIGNPELVARPRFNELWTQMAEALRGEDEFAAEDARQVAEQTRRGRPEIGRVYGVRLPDWRLKAIDEYAARNDLKRAEVLRRAIDAGMKVLRAEEPAR